MVIAGGSPPPAPACGVGGALRRWARHRSAWKPAPAAVSFRAGGRESPRIAYVSLQLRATGSSCMGCWVSGSGRGWVLAPSPFPAVRLGALALGNRCMKWWAGLGMAPAPRLEDIWGAGREQEGWKGGCRGPRHKEMDLLACHLHCGRRVWICPWIHHCWCPDQLSQLPCSSDITEKISYYWNDQSKSEVIYKYSCNYCCFSCSVTGKTISGNCRQGKMDTGMGSKWQVPLCLLLF